MIDAPQWNGPDDRDFDSPDRDLPYDPAAEEAIEQAEREHELRQDAEIDAEALIYWQRNIMGNHCTICWNRNNESPCSACGFWGYVVPDGWESECYSHCVQCPECGQITTTHPTEGVPDQLLRNCDNCGRDFWQDLDWPTYDEEARAGLMIGDVIGRIGGQQ